MKSKTVSLLCDPITHDPLDLVGELGDNRDEHEFLVNRGTGKQYPVRQGIPSFLDETEVVGSNKKYRDLYDRIARGYDITEIIGARLMYGGRDKVRQAILKDVQVPAGARVLEVSIGTGTNLKYFPSEAEYHGLDISRGMLEQCQRNLKKWRLEAELFHGNGEALPFNDRVFDVVFHFGGINFFSDKKKAILEMIRVAKPGAALHIGDETEDLAKEYANSPLLFSREFYAERLGNIVNPVELVPPEMLDIKSNEIWNGKFYMLSFRNPS